jgi:glutamate carboxypeptidase
LLQKRNRKRPEMTPKPHRGALPGLRQVTEAPKDRVLAGWEAELEAASARLLARVSDLVQVESPTSNPDGVGRAMERVGGWLGELGGRVERHPGQGRGEMLEARFGAADDPAPPVLLLGHLDTVWPVGTLARMPFRVEDGWAYGPGVLDMKAGVVMAVEALRLVQEADLRRPVILLLSGDEETGSHCSRARIEAVASRCRAVFVLEPAQGEEGAYKTERKGVGQYRLEIAGRAAHSGVDFFAGRNAVRELAYQIEQISGMTNPERGTTLNVGVVGGGTQPNVVAAEAWAEIDLRVRTLREAEQMDARLRALTPRDAECRLRVTGGMNRPPMERSAGTAALFEQARAIAAELGLELQEAATGGGSDGNFTAALGIPTLDGMGATGRGAHAENESIRISSLVLRTVLLAAMIARTS